MATSPSQVDDEGLDVGSESSLIGSRRTLDEVAETLFEAVRRDGADSPLRRPTGTYRLQLHRDFGFKDLDRVIDYLHDLGVSDVYLSPYLAARQGSTHGYDVIDHGRINPEVGDEAEHESVLDRLKARGMGRVLDIVPNHMGFDTTNPFMLDVLENGPQAEWAGFFDIDWTPVKDALEGRVLLPILEDLYGKVLESGLLNLEIDGGSLWVDYHGRKLPLRPRSYAMVLDRRGDVFRERFCCDDEDVLEYLSIRDSAQRLPSCRFCEPHEVEQVRREKEVVKRRIQRLRESSPRLKAFLDENVASFRGVEGRPHSFDGLHELLEDQVYRLAYWRVASEEINYRRFFDVTELAGIRVEDPRVFEHVHRLIFKWVRDGGVTGLRVDHPDGLADPLAYFQRLQETIFLVACRAKRDADAAESDWPSLALLLRGRLARELADDPASPMARRFPVVVEKILSTGEKLPQDWPVDGTVGYEFLNALNGMYVDPTASETLGAIYREFTGDNAVFADVLHDSKVYIESALLASELNTLTRMLSRVAESNRLSRDFTLDDLRRVLVETVACFRVYRTYFRPGETMSTRDRDYIDQAVARARRRLPTVDRLVFDFLRDVLAMNHPDDVADEERTLRERFVVRFQQTTGPVQAKGLEDTTFYRQVPLISINEVGGDPSRYGNTPSIFHALNAHRLSEWPGGLSTTATHDTKRGEDARIRISVISELAEEWKMRLQRWNRWNARKKTTVNEAPCPDAVEEYLLYQTLIGACPFDVTDDALPDAFIERVAAYMVKAVSEAKRNTTWIDPDATYKDTLARYVTDILDGPDAVPFLHDFLPFQRRIARIGMVHSLSQTLLKLASPGVADVYQGCEMWDLSLVDPDNRRPVDYEARSATLARIQRELDSGKPRAELAADLYAGPEDGAIKLYVTWTLLNHRKANPDLYRLGGYRPVEVEGVHKDRVVAFWRYYQGQHVLVVAPRLVAPLMGEDGTRAPIGQDVWGDTVVVLPDALPTELHHLLTGISVDASSTSDVPRRLVPLGLLFEQIPIAILYGASPSRSA